MRWMPDVRRQRSAAAADVADGHRALGGAAREQVVEPAEAGPGAGEELAPLPREDDLGEVRDGVQHPRGSAGHDHRLVRIAGGCLPCRRQSMCS